MKANIGIVYAATQPQWTSCISILSGLYKAYQDFFSNENVILYDLPAKGELYQRSQLSQKILTDKLTKLIFISHAPNPKELIFFLRQHTSNSDELPLMYFHIYGDFSYQALSWYKLNPYLKDLPLSIVCASHSQQRFVDNLLEKNANFTDYCPFPVDDGLFQYDPALRKSARRKYQIQDDEFVFLYTGRMSIQKNIVEMCREFILFSEECEKPCKLLLAGLMDDIGAPFFKINLPAGYYFYIWDNFLKELTPKQQERIVFLGSKPQAELVDLYHASDCYYSLSLYHDEDYGMSPVESLSCGTPAILTDWGGFPSFAQNSSFCDLVNVSIEDDGLNIDLPSLRLLFSKQISQKLTEQQRQDCSDHYHNHFSIKCLKKYLSDIHSRPLKKFPGFNWKLKEISNYIYRYPTKMSFYEEVYYTYISKHPRNHDR